MRDNMRLCRAMTMLYKELFGEFDVEQAEKDNNVGYLTLNIHNGREFLWYFDGVKEGKIWLDTFEIDTEAE